MILESRIERLLMIRAPILLGQVDRGNRYAQDNEHHCQEQLRAETQRRGKAVIQANGLVTWLENRHAMSCRLSVPLGVLERHRQLPRL